jgi:hypothetical protein
LISRTFCLSPNGATIDYRNLVTGAAIIRSIRPEAILTIDGKRYKVGGLEGQPEHVYIQKIKGLVDYAHSKEIEPGGYSLLTYFDHIRNFIKKTGFDLLEHDGSYSGDLCASTTHQGHTGLEDSQWKQWAKICDFYKLCREKGVYLNVPDWYFAAGSSKTSIGYRETN